MTITIKRYQNRKFYNTESKRYLKLDDIREIVANGEDIRVVSHPSGEDITLRILSQLIFEQSKHSSGNFEHGIFSSLIRSRAILAGKFHHLITGRSVDRAAYDQAICNNITALVNSGRLPEVLADELIHSISRIELDDIIENPRIEVGIENLFDKVKVASRKDYQNLIDRVDELSSKIEELGRE